jgi:hypothetical protein
MVSARQDCGFECRLRKRSVALAADQSSRVSWTCWRSVLSIGSVSVSTIDSSEAKVHAPLPQCRAYEAA